MEDFLRNKLEKNKYKINFMRYLNSYGEFLKENISPDEMVELVADINILESIVTDSDLLLKSIQAKEEDIFKTFEVNPDEFKEGYSIEELYKSKDFNKKLKNKKLKKSPIEETEDSETFIENTMDVKFFLIHEKNKSALDKPEYIVFQTKKKVDTKWSDVKLYSVNDDIKNFYDKLTNKTVELKKGDKKYIYFTSNSCKNWQIQNGELADDIFLELMDKEQIKMLLKDKDVLITIIA